MVQIALRLFLFLVYFAALASLSVLPGRWRRGLVLRVQATLARAFLRTYGVRLPRANRPRVVPGALVISNHTSLLDTFVLIALYRSRFITSREMGELPGVGWIARASLCLFTERRKSHRTLETSPRELAEVADLLQNGSNVGLFPEGTTTDGTQVLPFKSFYFEAARMANRSIIPLQIRWHVVGSERVPPVFSGELTLGGHLWNLIHVRRLRLELTRFPVIHPYPKETPRELCARAAELYHEPPLMTRPMLRVGAMPR